MASVCLFVLAAVAGANGVDDRPNILWIYVDDMSDWIGCYGDDTVPTPNIDSLARSGVKFDQAFMPAPVCSSTRSALITGTMQTTHGLHQHRTMIKKPLPEGIVTVPELLREAGYITFNEAKDDYNFERRRDLMYSTDFKRPGFKSHFKGRDLTWLKQLQGKRFFGQIQLAGGKFGGETGSKYPVDSRVPASRVVVPPQYPDTPVFRNAIARHYEQIAETDAQVGAIIHAMKEYKLWENTVVFFFTDHGCPLPRSKQFLYDEGTRVPLIISWAGYQEGLSKRGAVRSDLVSGIDISATTLALAGVDIPEFVEGRDLLADDYVPRKYVISARDRLGIAVDHVRTVRSEHFRYIRNYKTDRPLFQSQYRDGYATFQELRKLRDAGKLTLLQASYFDVSKRAAEELYQLDEDPHEVVNLASQPKYRAVLEQHRQHLKAWEETTDDKGRYPESEASLRLVFERANGNCAAPEFDFLKKQPRR